MKIKISKSQWEGIGKKAGWMKKADWDRPVAEDIEFTSIYQKIAKQVEKEIRNLKGIDNIEVTWRNPHSFVMKFHGYSKSDFEASGTLWIRFNGSDTEVNLYAKTLYGESNIMENVVTEGKLPLQNIIYNIWAIFQ